MSDTLDFVSKLFDTLKEASKDSNTALQRLVSQQQELVNHVKGLPITELHEALKDHDTNSKGEIDACTETVETKTDTILTKVNLIDGKIGKMITVVLVAFGLLAGTYIFVRSAVDVDSNGNHSQLEQKIDSLEKAVKELHPQ